MQEVPLGKGDLLGCVVLLRNDPTTRNDSRTHELSPRGGVALWHCGKVTKWQASRMSPPSSGIAMSGRRSSATGWEVVIRRRTTAFMEAAGGFAFLGR